MGVASAPNAEHEVLCLHIGLPKATHLNTVMEKRNTGLDGQNCPITHFSSLANCSSFAFWALETRLSIGSIVAW